jgi:hypothetical protein
MKPEGQGDAMWSSLQRTVQHAEEEPLRFPEPEATGEQPAGDVAAADPRRHEDVKQKVRELIGKYPTVRSQQLYDLAVRMHPELEEGGLRSFHARYVLPIKREVARAEGRVQQPRTRKSAPQRRTRRQHGTSPGEETAGATTHVAPADTAQTRARVRGVLMRLSRELVTAETRADIVDVLARMEDLVDEVIAATQPEDSAGTT